MLLVATAKTILGSPLPRNAVGWAGMLIGLWASLGTIQVVIVAFIDHHLGQPVKLSVSGYILPFGWVVWGGALIFGKPGPLQVLIVLLGLLVMLVSAAQLRKARESGLLQPEGENA